MTPEQRASIRRDCKHVSRSYGRLVEVDHKALTQLLDDLDALEKRLMALRVLFPSSHLDDTLSLAHEVQQLSMPQGQMMIHTLSFRAAELAAAVRKVVEG